MLGLAVVVVAMAGLLGACGGTSRGDGPLDVGREVYSARCSACHGNRGQGGIGPAFKDVVETFPNCHEQIRWITLGSEGWKDSIGPTYGATDKPIDNVMPAMGTVLTDDEIASVAAFERSQYGGLDPDEAIAGCGLAVPEG